MIHGSGGAVLFDLDGTLINNVPYNGDVDKVKFVWHARESIAMLRRRGIKTVCVTNQSGINRGFITHSQVRAINEKVKDHLLLDWIGYCQHKPDEKCDCRKPGTGLVEQARHELNYSFTLAVVGDSECDELLARKIGVPFYDVRVMTLRTAIRLICHKYCPLTPYSKKGQILYAQNKRWKK